MIIKHEFGKPMRFADGAQYTYEIDLAWQPTMDRRRLRRQRRRGR